MSIRENRLISGFEDWLGKRQYIEDSVSPALAERFLVTLDLPNSSLRHGDVVPGLVHFCLAQPQIKTSLLGVDGHIERGLFLPPVPLPNRMWIGGELTFFDHLRVGDSVRRSSEVTKIEMKKGRSGRLCFVTIQHVIENQHRIVIKERQEIVFRERLKATRKEDCPAVRPLEHRRVVKLSALDLFRYSAITFNSHRIHYDRDYARLIEGYPGLVVHGPLQATLLFEFASSLHGVPPSHFMFRSLSSLFDDDEILLDANEEDNRMTLRAWRAGSSVAMEAEATWK